MRTFLRAAVVLGTLGTSVVAMADTPKTPAPAPKDKAPAADKDKAPAADKTTDKAPAPDTDKAPAADKATDKAPAKTPTKK